MLGIPYQDTESLKNTLEFIKECDVPHISAYMLKIEEGTFFDTHSNRREPFPHQNENGYLKSLKVVDITAIVVFVTTRVRLLRWFTRRELL